MTENRCERCNRVISDPNARYGWRCAEILGVSEELNYAGDEVFRAFILGAQAADEFTWGKNLGESEKQIVYEAMVKRFLSADMHDADLWSNANNESKNAAKDKSSKSLVEYMSLRDLFDYRNGTFLTTRYLDKASSDETKNLQHALNEIGIRDKFGKRLIEDGLYGPKTQWANDVLIKGLAHSLQYDSKAFLQNGKYKIGESTHRNLPNYLNQIFDVSTKKPLFRVDYGKVPGNSVHRYHINVKTLDDALPYQKAFAKRLDHTLISKSTYDIFERFDNIEEISKKGGKSLAVVGYVFDAYELSTAVYADLSDEDGKIGRTTVNSTVGIGGSWAGGALGAKAGAWGGTAIGTLICPGLGTAIGGFVGGAIGGMAGSYAGRELGEHLVDKGYEITEEYNEKKKAYQY